MSRTFSEAVVRARAALGGGYHLLTLEAPAIAAAAEPGQFVLLSPRGARDPGVDPLLPRPFSLVERDAAQGTVEIFFREVGQGTALLAAVPLETPLRILGPLGKPWPAPEGEAFVVGGGVGMPPILDLAATLAAAGQPVRAFYGGRGAEHIHLVDRFEGARVPLQISTDDGSVGHAGRVTEPLAEALRACAGAATVYACGPEPMLAAVAQVAKAAGRRAWLSLEAPMACGVGVCRGCAVQVGEGYQMVCVDGPVFDASEVYP